MPSRGPSLAGSLPTQSSRAVKSSSRRASDVLPLPVTDESAPSTAPPGPPAPPEAESSDFEVMSRRSTETIANLTKDLDSTVAQLRLMKTQAFSRPGSELYTPYGTLRRPQSLPTGPGMHGVSYSPRRPPARQEVDSSLFSARLAEQLQGLTSLTSTIRDGFAASPQARRQQAEAEKPEASYDCKQYTVGRVHSALTSTLHVHHDCFRFHFGHPRQGRIHVFLYFKDVDRATVSVRKQLFTFHVDRPLRTWFGTEYDPADPQHAVSMRLCKRAEVDEFAERMQQTLPGRVTVVP